MYYVLRGGGGLGIDCNILPPPIRKEMEPDMVSPKRVTEYTRNVYSFTLNVALSLL